MDLYRSMVLCGIVRVLCDSFGVSRNSVGVLCGIVGILCDSVG